jgi:hypothetical protein
MRLGFVLQVNEKCGILTAKSGLDEQVARPAPAVKGEPLRVHELDMIEVDETVDCRQKLLEEVSQKAARPQKRLEERIMVHHPRLFHNTAGYFAKRAEWTRKWAVPLAARRVVLVNYE